jgi:hypothetical protein
MTDRNTTKKLINIIIFSIIILLILGYTGYEAQKVVFGPRIEVESPTSGISVSDSLIEIKGNVKNTRDLFLNDRKIFIDENGNFEEKLLLSYGYNIIFIKAIDKFEREKSESIEIVYK